MANKASIESTKAAKEGCLQRVAARAELRKTVPKSESREVAKPSRPTKTDKL